VCSEDQHIVSWKIMMPFCKSMKCPFIITMVAIANQNWEDSKYVWTSNFWNSTQATFYWEITDFICETNLFLSKITIRGVYECMITSNFQFSWIRFRFSATVDFRDLMTSYDLISHIICIMIFAMYGGGLDKNVDGSFVTVCWKVMLLGRLMFPPPHNSAYKYTRVDPSSWTDIYP